MSNGYSMTRDELEFHISQYLDGTLVEPEQSSLEARLAEDADARALLDEYRRLDVALKAAPVPAVNWDALSAQICGAVADQQEEPAGTYRIGFFRTMAGLAVAASVLVGMGFGIRMVQQSQTTDPVGTGTGMVAVNTNVPREPVEIVVVDAGGAVAPEASTKPVEVIAVGPSPAAEGAPVFAGYHDDIISRPSRVFVARGTQPVHDGAFLP
jgi:anti-sigma factor RsiW